MAVGVRAASVSSVWPAVLLARHHPAPNLRGLVQSVTGRGQSSTCFAKTLRDLKTDRDELRDATLGHGPPEQPIHARHGDLVVVYNDVAVVSEFRHLVEQIAEPINVMIIERGVDLVEHANGGGVREEYGKDQGERG